MLIANCPLVCLESVADPRVNRNKRHKLVDILRRNLLIAGSSASTLLGGDDDDILIGGTTAYDMNLASLQAIMDYWSTTLDDYATRVGNLLAGNGVPLLDATTVTSNGGGNILNGGPGLNLYYGNATDITDFDPSSGALFIPV
jgi:hypothetical protein